MVSSLWKACAEGDVDKVAELLNEGQVVDIEVKDHTGVTPLICAVQTGKMALVKLLLDRGADPTNSSSQGPPEHYTADPAVLGLLAAAKNAPTLNAISHDVGYAHESKPYFQPPPGAYYYPGVPIPPSMLPDGSVAYYPPPPHPVDANGGNVGNLPPPDIARMIPCRYYPACRYGASCLFAHPQAPYLQGPLPPPAQYPTPYDPMSAPPYTPYYPMSPPAFPPPPNGLSPNPPPSNPVPPVGVPLTMTHTRSGSELAQTTYSPSAIPPPAHYGAMSPVSPGYTHQGPIPVPLSIPPLPTIQHSLSAQSQSPQQNIYPPTSPSAPNTAPNHFLVHRDSIGQQSYTPQGIILPAPVEATSPRSPVHPADGYGHTSMNRDGTSHARRGGVRRPSFGGMSRKPPCLFFPSGRCRNGDDCRFPHVLPDNQVQQHNPSYFGGRGTHRPRPASHVNGFAVVEEKFAALNVQDHDRQSPGTNGANGTDASSRSQSTEPGSRSRSQGFKSNHFSNGTRIADKRMTAPRPQRVPSADEFPVLSGSSTPPLRSPGPNGSFLNGHSGPTAAQVLQAPPPPRKDRDSEPVPGGSSSDGMHSIKEITDVNNCAGNVPVDIVSNKLPLSFAAVTTAAPDISKEVSVSA